MICPDKQLDMWEYCDNSVILANSDWYYTKQQTEELIDSVSGMNPTEVQDMINRSIHSKADKTYVDEQDAELSDSIRAINSNLTRVYTKTDVNNLLDRKQNVLIAGSGITISGDVISSTGGGGDVTSGQVQSMIDHSISGKVDTSTFNTYSASTNVAINNKQDTLIAGDNITIVNNVISSTASGDVTSAQVETMIATSISGKADTTAVTQDIATATNDMATQTWVQNQGYLTEHQSLSAYSTTDEMNQAISAATDDMATETWVGNQGYITGVDLSNYATLQDIPTSNSALTNDAGYITSAALNGYATEDYVTAATNDMATETWVGEQGYLTEHQSLSAYSTTVEMNNAIDAAVSGKADTSTVEALGGVLTAHTANTTIHITQAERTAWNAKSDFSGDYNDLTNKPTNVSSFNNDVGYLTEHQSLSAYSTTVEVNNAIDAAVSGKADSTAVTQDIAAATDDMATQTWVQNQGYLTEHQSLSAYSTTQEMNDAITAATDDMATETWVNQQGFLTEHQSLSAYSTTAEMNQAISAATSGKVDTSTYTAYTSATDTALQGKQPTLVSGTNIKTINNESILGSGNITVQGSGNPTVEVTQAEYDALAVKDPNTFYIITDAEAVDIANYYTKSETDDLLDTKLDVSAYTPTDLSNYYTKSETSGATQISTALNAKADTATTYTKTEVDTALGGKQTTLVSGTNIKTINNESLLGSGNITIEGGGGKAINAGRGISITTGETADTVSLNEAISASTASSSTYIAIGSGANAVAGYNSFLSNSGGIAIGSGATANRRDICIGNRAMGYNNSHSGLICIGLSSVSKQGGISIGNYSEAYGESGYDQYGGISIGFNSKTQSRNAIAIGYNTVASGTTKTNINNQLKIDTSNQVYIYNKDNTEMICLQDQLGGSSSYTAGDGIDITNDVISVTGKVDTSAITTSMSSASTDSQVPSAKAVYDQFGGLKLVKLSQAEYDALATKDTNTLYVIV